MSVALGCSNLYSSSERDIISYHIIIIVNIYFVLCSVGII